MFYFIMGVYCFKLPFHAGSSLSRGQVRCPTLDVSQWDNGTFGDRSVVPPWMSRSGTMDLSPNKGLIFPPYNDTFNVDFTFGKYSLLNAGGT